MTANVLASEFQEEQDETAGWHWTPKRKIRAPVDEIAPEHQGVDRICRRWGTWNRRRAGGSSLASAESLYTKYGTPPSTAPLDADPEIMAVELAVIRMVSNEVMQYHGQTVILLYVKNYSPFTICRALKVRYEDFPRWTWTAREMVRAALVVRRYGT